MTLKQVIAQMWPFISTMCHDILKNQVEPEVQKKMPTGVPLLKSFKFLEADLGNHVSSHHVAFVFFFHVYSNYAEIFLAKKKSTF